MPGVERGQENVPLELHTWICTTAVWDMGSCPTLEQHIGLSTLQPSALSPSSQKAKSVPPICDPCWPRNKEQAGICNRYAKSTEVERDVRVLCWYRDLKKRSCLRQAL